MCHADIWLATDGELLGARMLHGLINFTPLYTAQKGETHASLSPLLLSLKEPALPGFFATIY
jgi:hypothetical protein